MDNSLSLKNLLSATVLLLAGVASSDVLAAADSPKDKQVRRFQLLLNAAQQEKADLTTQVEALTKRATEAEFKRAALEKKLGGKSKQLNELADKQQQADLLDKQQQDELSIKFQESEKKLKEAQEQNVTVSKDLQQLKLEKEQEQQKLAREIQVCEKKNTELYILSAELMDKYKAKGVLQAMRQAEPFTQLEKVKMENLLQEYRDKSDANLIPVKSMVAQDVQRP